VSPTGAISGYFRKNGDAVNLSAAANCLKTVIAQQGGSAMRLSTRNQFPGTVTEVNVGGVMATVKVRLDGGDQIVTASITKDAVEELGLAEGIATIVLVKSTEVTLAVD
jgi:molybdopterin-binding protein